MRYLLVILGLLFTFSSVLADDYNVYRLQNGQTVIIKELHDNKIVTIDTWIKTGSINENDKNNGTAHFLEHLFFKGTEQYPNGVFDKILESKGAITNAATSKDYTHYYITIPSKDFELALNLHADMMLNPLIPRKELEKERKVVLEEISRSNDNPTTKLYDNMITAFYKSHPYKRKVIGTKDVIETVTREEIIEYYQKYYSPANMVTIIVGDVETSKVIKDVEKLFGAKTTLNNNAKIVYKKEKSLPKSMEIVEKADVQTSYILIGFRGVDSKNIKESCALDLLSTVLGDGKTSRLYQNIKEQKRLAFIISSGHSTNKDDSIFYVNANYKIDDYEKLKNSIITEIENLKTTPISNEEIKKAKNIIERDTYYSRESGSNIANELGYMTVMYDDANAYQNYIGNINKLTAKDLQTAAKKYLDFDKMVVSVINPQMLEIANKTKKTSIPTEKKLPVPINSDGSISKYILNNKAELLLNKNEANDIIAIQIYAKGGNFIENKAGTASLMASAMLKGTKKYSAQELMQLLEENGIKLNTIADADAFRISIKATKKELPIIFDVLDEVVNNAVFDPHEIEKIKSEKLQAIKKNRDNPMNVALEEFKARIWGDYPYAITGKTYEKTFSTIKSDDIFELYKKMFYPENIVISINGNLDVNVLAENFEKIFNSSEGSKLEISDFKKDFQFKKNIENINITKDSEAAWLVLGYPTEGIMSEKDYATLQVIDALLGTGMSSRLFTDLRDSQGLAYQVGSSYSPQVNAGVFALFIGTNPKNIDVAKNGMLNAINTLKKEFVSDKELTETKDKILGNYVLSFETNMEKAGTLGWYETTNRSWKFKDKYPQLIQSVTASDIIGVANKYFSKPHLYVLVSPNKTVKN